MVVFFIIAFLTVWSGISWWFDLHFPKWLMMLNTFSWLHWTLNIFFGEIYIQILQCFFFPWNMSLFILVLPTKDHLHMVMAKHYEGLLAAVVREPSHHGKPQGDSGWRCERGLIIVYGLLLGDLGEDPRKWWLSWCCQTAGAIQWLA